MAETKLFRTLRLGMTGPDVHGGKRAVYRLLAREEGDYWKHYQKLTPKKRELFGLSFQKHLLKAQKQLGIKRRYRGRLNQRTLDALRKKDAVDSVADQLLKEGWPPPVPEKVHPLPAGVPFRIVGYPGQGTHNAYDWQSRNALDFHASAGTKVLAPRAGYAARVGGTNGIRYVGGKIIFGQKVTIRTDVGPDIFLTHLADVTVSDGHRIEAGQVLGKIGNYGPGSHVHIAFEYGDPQQMLEWKRIVP